MQFTKHWVLIVVGAQGGVYYVPTVPTGTAPSVRGPYFAPPASGPITDGAAPLRNLVVKQIEYYFRSGTSCIC
jgi:hypothetical protein